MLHTNSKIIRSAFYYNLYTLFLKAATKSHSLFQDQKVLSLRAKDGDVKNLRPIIFSIEQDVLKYFSVQNHGDGNATIVTTDNPIDREDPLVKQMGGIYTFNVKVSHFFLILEYFEK